MTTTYIILVNWNGRQDTIECLDSLMRLDTDDFSVVVVDNGSVDDTIGALQAWETGGATRAVREGPIWSTLPPERRHDPTLRVVSLADESAPRPNGARVTLLAAGRNLGFAAANNIGMDFAVRDPGARFLWLLNNDTVARPDALSQLVAHADGHLDQAMIGSTLLYHDAPQIVQGLGGWTRPNRALAGHIGFGGRADELPDQAQVEAELAYVMGASMFVRRDLFDRTGGMSDDYFLYYEELDWVRRLPKGARLGICLASVVYHKEGGSIGTSSVARPSDTSLYYYTVNTLRYVWRYDRRHVPVTVARFGWNLIGYCRRRDGAAVRVGLHALRDALSGRRRTGPYGGPEFTP
jgi:GT2 family glycosyltransferase